MESNCNLPTQSKASLTHTASANRKLRPLSNAT